MSTTTTTRLVTLFLCGILLSGCDYRRANDSADPGSAEALHLALQQSIDNIIIPQVTAFKTEADATVASADTFCAATNIGNLDDLQDQWKDLSLQWNRIAMYNIGPLNDNLISPTINYIESMRLNGQDYTGTVRSNITTILGNATVLDQDYFDDLSFSRVGMLALEVLIFETSDTQDTDAADIVADYQNNPRKCEYLQGMAQLMARQADAIDDGWRNEYLDTGKSFRNILLDGELDDGAESVPALITAMQEHLDYIKRRKLDATPDAQIADHFYENVIATLDAIKDLFEGTNNQSHTFFKHMNDTGFGTYETLLRNNITTARSAANNENRSALSSAIGVLDGNFKREVPDGLNVELGLNFTDGD